MQFSSENQRKILFLVIKKHSNDQCDCRKCYINICDIKNRKIDQDEIKEINGYSDKQVEEFVEIIKSTAHLIMEFAKEGGFEHASGF